MNDITKTFITKINTNSSKEFWYTGMILDFIKDTKCYEDLGYKSFSSFIKN
jgi:hypothetical protein